MKKFTLHALIMTCLIALAGCGTKKQAPAPSSDQLPFSEDAGSFTDVPSADDALSSDNTLFSDDAPSPDDSRSFDNTLSPEDSLSSENTPSSGDSLFSENTPSSGDSLSSENTPSSGDSLSSENTPSSGDSLSLETSRSPEELAHAAYSALLSGDNSLLDEESLRIWHLEEWSDFLQSGFIYEYTYFDLDGDGMTELLIQMEDAPLIYNAVFHYADGRLFCWNSDTVEMTGGNYPLQDGTMVSEYHFNDTCSYTIFRFLPSGEYETLSSLYARESLADEDSDEPCPYYEIDGQEVDQAVFEEQLKERITSQLLPRSAWTTL